MTQTTLEPEVRSPGAERRRQRVLDAASQCFARNGFAKTTVEEIATAAGVSKGLVYAYFESKDALLDAVLEKAIGDWKGASDAAAGASGARTARERFEVVHRAGLEYARTNPLLRSILAQDQRVLLAGREDLWRGLAESWRLSLIELMRSGIEAGEFRPDLDVERTADVIRVLYWAVIERLFGAASTIDVSADAFVAATSELMLYGIAGWPAGREAAKP